MLAIVAATEIQGQFGMFGIVGEGIAGGDTSSGLEGHVYGLLWEVERKKHRVACRLSSFHDDVLETEVWRERYLQQQQGMVC